MSPTSRRKLLSTLFVGFCALSVLLALVPLTLILFFVVSQGVQALNWDFLRRCRSPSGRTAAEWPTRSCSARCS